MSIKGDLNAAGAFALSAQRLAQINGGPLADGPHVLHLQALDGTGQVVSAADVPFVLDTQAPSATLDLDPASDSAPLGDQTTTFRRVTLIGVAEPNAQVSLAAGFADAAHDNRGCERRIQLRQRVSRSRRGSLHGDGNGSRRQHRGRSARSRGAVPQGSATVVLDWNNAALDAVKEDASDPAYASRAMGIVQAAVYDAVNSVDDASTALFVHVTPPVGARMWPPRRRRRMMCLPIFIPRKSRTSMRSSPLPCSV